MKREADKMYIETLTSENYMSGDPTAAYEHFYGKEKRDARKTPDEIILLIKIRIRNTQVAEISSADKENMKSLQFDICCAAAT